MKQKEKLWTKNFIFVSLANFLLFIAFYVLIVTLAVYSMDQFHASESKAGLVSSIFVLGAVLVRPIAGRTIEKVGKKKLFLFGLLMFFVMMLFYFPINNLALLLLIRFIHGFAFGISTTAAGTIVADIIPMSRSGEGMGYYATSTNLAMAIGPFLGLYMMRSFDSVMIFITTTVFAAIAFIAALFLRLPKRMLSQATAVEGTSGFRLSGYFEKSTIRIGILVALLGAVYSSILSFFSAYAVEINLVDAASFFFVMYAVFLLISRPFTGQMFDRLGENAVVYPSLIVFGLGMVLLSQAYDGAVLLMAGALIGVGFGTFQSSAQTIAIKEAKRERIGLATATFFVFFDTGVGLGPFLLGFLLPLIGYRELYVTMAVIIFLSVFIYYVLHGSKAAARKKQRQVNISTRQGEEIV